MNRSWVRWIVLGCLAWSAACAPAPTRAPEPTDSRLTGDQVATLLAAPLPANTLVPPPITPIATPDLTQASLPNPDLTATPTRDLTLYPMPGQATPTTGSGYPAPGQGVAESPPSGTALPTRTPAASVTPGGHVPDFTHIFVLVFENKEFGSVIGNSQMPVLNRLARENTLLTQYYAVRHPSLPNYVALIGGDTFNIDSDCETCYVNSTSLPDLIEAAGRTWRTYQEDMPSACFTGGSSGEYAKKHNPFMYFDPIRTNAARCQAGVVPLTQLEADLTGGNMPDFAFITPNLCNSGHDCGLDVSDAWIGTQVDRIVASPAYDDSSLIVLTWDEGQGEHTCCGLTTGGGRVAAVLISPLAKTGFEDDTPYSHYSLLATIADAWKLPRIGHAADAETSVIMAPWE
jgi:hypothetical protein